MVRVYVECQNASAVARKYGCSEATVRRILRESHDVLEELETERRKNIHDIKEHMRKQTPKVCEVMDDLLEQIGDEETLKKASARDLALALGILIDKYSRAEEQKEQSESGVIVLPEAK